MSRNIKTRFILLDSKLHEVVKTLEAKNDPKRYKSQITLAKRRIEAFTIAADLIQREISTFE